MIIAWADGIGTGDMTPHDERSILLTVVRSLTAKLQAQRHRVEAVRIEWPASMAGIGGPKSWATAARVGVLHLDQLVRDRPDEKLVLLGYSGGNRVVHDWLDTQTPETLSRVVAVGLMSDPYRPRDRWQNRLDRPDGWGVCGERHGPIPARTFWTVHPDDVIGACPEDSPLRTLADLSDRIPGGFLKDFSGHMRLNSWQLATRIGMWRRDPLGYLRSLGPRMDRARRGVEGYLASAHTLAYLRDYVTVDPRTGEETRAPLAERLASTIAWALR